MRSTRTSASIERKRRANSTPFIRGISTRHQHIGKDQTKPVGPRRGAKIKRFLAGGHRMDSIAGPFQCCCHKLQSVNIVVHDQDFFARRHFRTRRIARRGIAPGDWQDQLREHPTRPPIEQAQPAPVSVQNPISRRQTETAAARLARKKRVRKQRLLGVARQPGSIVTDGDHDMVARPHVAEILQAIVGAEHLLFRCNLHRAARTGRLASVVQKRGQHLPQMVGINARYWRVVR
jgi:hypothetical protein